MIDSVLASAHRGWHVFPLPPLSKIPKVKWSEWATNNEESVKRWWAKHPDDNYGIATGPSGLVVIDIDVFKGKDAVNTNGEVVRELFGIEAWSTLVRDTGMTKEPRTFEVWTPSGGEHLYFKANDAMKVKNSISKLAPGIDVRAEGGFVVGPGSRTEQGTYEIHLERKPAALPSWLRNELATASAATTPVQESSRERRQRDKRISNSDNYAVAALKGEVEKVRSTPIGAGLRNKQLNESAFKLRKHIEAGQLNAHDVADELFSAAMAINMKSTEAEATIRSGLGV
jgi:hypothetical protein